MIFDEQQQKLIYDRRLEEGSGSSIYGLEVCKAMDLEPNFLNFEAKMIVICTAMGIKMQKRNMVLKMKVLWIWACLQIVRAVSVTL